MTKRWRAIADDMDRTAALERSLAKGQALALEADRLRFASGQGRHRSSATLHLFRN